MNITAFLMNKCIFMCLEQCITHAVTEIYLIASLLHHFKYQSCHFNFVMAY